MATVTGTILTPDGAAFSGSVKFYPDSALKLLAAGQVTGSVISATVTAGTLSQVLTQGAYLVQVDDGATARFRIVVPDSEDSIDIASLVSSGSANLPYPVDVVDSWNARTGDVVPEAGDYEAADVTAAASATNYTPTGATAEGHLSGIDTALGEKAAAADLTSHTGDTSNPHGVTAAQAGADPSGTAAAAVSAHAAGSGVHAIAGVTGLQTALDAKAAAADLTSHTGNTSNPHGVTAAQAGADPSGTAAAAVSAHAAGSGVHAIAGVTGLQTALDGKITLGNVFSSATMAAAVVSGSGTASANSYGVALNSDAAAACLLRATWGNALQLYYLSGSRRIYYDRSWCMSIPIMAQLNNANARLVIAVGITNSASSLTLPGNGVRVRLQGQTSLLPAIYIGASDGTTFSESGPYQMTGSSAVYRVFAIDFTAGTSVALRMDGETVLTHTTNLPTVRSDGSSNVYTGLLLEVTDTVANYVYTNLPMVSFP